MTKRQRETSKTLGEAMRASLQTAHLAGCTLAELAVLHAVHVHTISWGKLSDRASTAQIAITAGLWLGDPKDCPHWVRRKVATRLQALSDAGAITYRPGGGEGWKSSVIAVPAAPSQGDPHEDPQGEPSEVPQGDPGKDPLGGAVTAPAGGPSTVRQGDPGARERGTRGGSPPRDVVQGNRPGRTREELRDALRATLAPALRIRIGKEGDGALDHIIDTALEHLTPDQLHHELTYIASVGKVDYLGQIWFALSADQHPWAPALAEAAYADELTRIGATP